MYIFISIYLYITNINILSMLFLIFMLMLQFYNISFFVHVTYSKLYSDLLGNIFDESQWMFLNLNVGQGVSVWVTVSRCRARCLGVGHGVLLHPRCYFTLDLLCSLFAILYWGFIHSLSSVKNYYSKWAIIFHHFFTSLTVCTL